ncbi:MAG: biopolymer transporter ExbD [Planctomycetota bacterium]|nr:biopolymer transporter ExbD [Planctomycetota bacterium]
MGKHQLPKLKEDISPNLVPMIDIMFLLLLFFMLGADMAQREAVDLILPKASKIKEDPTNSEKPTTTVNIHRKDDTDTPFLPSAGAGRDGEKWVVSVRGIDFTPDTLKGRLQADADENPEPDIDPAAGKRLSDRLLLIRADQGAPYGFIQRVIEVSGSVGLYKVEVAGAAPTAPGA